MEKITICEFTNEYQEEVIELILNIQRNEFAIPISKEDQPDLMNIPDFYQQGYGNFWLAVYQKQVVGTIALIDIGNQQAVIRKMFVNADYRGKTYNTAGLLLQKLLAWARERTIAEIYLGTTEKFLAAHRFYEKNGFVQIAQEQLPDTFLRMKVDTRFYTVKL